MNYEGRLTEIMKAIDRLSRERGYPPTVREIGVAIGVPSTATVHQAINVLKRREWAVSDSRIPRSLRLTELGVDWMADE